MNGILHLLLLRGRIQAPFTSHLAPMNNEAHTVHRKNHNRGFIFARAVPGVSGPHSAITIAAHRCMPILGFAFIYPSLYV